MRKKIWRIVIATILLFVIAFTLWDCFLWRLFEFNYCEEPEYLSSIIEVEGNNCYICITSNYIGSFSSTAFNSIIYKFDDGILKIGAHKSISLNAFTEISKEISVNSPISEVLLCGKDAKKIIYQSGQ